MCYLYSVASLNTIITTVKKGHPITARNASEVTFISFIASTIPLRDVEQIPSINLNI